MNLPLNEQKLRVSVHEAVEKESIINLIILLMLIRVVQVISLLRPGELPEEIMTDAPPPKRIAVKDVKVTLNDGSEIPAHNLLSESFDSNGIHRIDFGQPRPAPEPTLGTRQRQAQVPTTGNTNQHGDQYAIDAWARNPAGFYSLLRVYRGGSADIAHVSPFVAETGGLLHGVPEVSGTMMRYLLSRRPAYQMPERNLSAHTCTLEDMHRDFEAAYGSFDRDYDMELTVAQSGQSEYLPEWTLDEDGRATYHQEFHILAHCITDCGQVQILHRQPSGQLVVSVYENGPTMPEAPEISAVYISFLVAQDDHVSGRRPYRMERHFGADVSGYCTPSRDSVMTGLGRWTGLPLSGGRFNHTSNARRTGFPSSYGEA